MKPIKLPKIPPGLARKGAIPALFLAALTGPLALGTLVRWEGDIHKVYADHLAGGLPTFCAGRTDWTAKVGTPLASDFCAEVNKTTLLEYGYAVLECANWDHLTADRLVALTIFAINVGKDGACKSQAVVNINRGRIAEGCNLIAYKPNGAPNWSIAGGKFVRGLHNRRVAERALCLRGLA
jgi:GH24 family phage-related lysozyme (muramidase)